MEHFQELANFIWSVADLLRGPYRPPQYERVMLPLTVLRRFDCVLAPTKDAVVKRYKQLRGGKLKNVDSLLNNLATGPDGKPLGFHNHSELDFRTLKGDPDHVGQHLTEYIAGFSEKVRLIFERFDFDKEIEKLEEANRLYLIVAKFADVDLHPSRVDNLTMGLIFEDLIRRFNEAANETAGDHFTPREVIRLMVNLLLEPDTRTLTTRGVIVTVCDPACGTGGMLSETYNWIKAHNPDALVRLFGQDYNPRSYAVAASDLLMKGLSDSVIEFGDTLTRDAFEGRHFDYLLANPPFGVDWKAQHKEVSREHQTRGYAGRFGPKLPRVNDGALLFLLDMVAKRDPETGSRIAIVFNGSPLFTGGAGSGESEIRRWIIENDWLEAIVGLPEQMFYNTGIGTFVWVVSTRKARHRKGKIQLIDARARWLPMRRSLGDKRRYLNDETIEAITREHGTCAPSETCQLFDNADFGYRRITVERPLRLRFQLTEEAKESFLDSVPEFLDAVLAIEARLGTDPIDDWNNAWAEVQAIAKEHGATWTAPRRKLFREVFTTVDPEAQPVIAKHGPLRPPDTVALPAGMDEKGFAALFGLHIAADRPKGKAEAFEYEPDPKLRDYENVPLKESVVDFFLREVRPYVADAWIDRATVDEKDGGVGKVGYEINFNREFFRYEEPRSLDAIDRELDAVERRILQMLRKVTT